MIKQRSCQFDALTSTEYKLRESDFNYGPAGRFSALARARVRTHACKGPIKSQLSPQGLPRINYSWLHIEYRFPIPLNTSALVFVVLAYYIGIILVFANTLDVLRNEYFRI